MAIGFDSSGLSALANDPSHTHTPVGVLRAVYAVVWTALGTDIISAVSFGASAMARVAASFKNTGETGGVYVYFLGVSIPAGAQTVSCTTSGTNQAQILTIGFTAAYDTEIVTSDATISSDSVADPSVTINPQGREGPAYIAFVSGQDAATGTAPTAGWSSLLETDAGTQIWGLYGYTLSTLGVTSLAAGWTQTAEDANAVAFHLSEKGSPMIRRRQLHTIGKDHRPFRPVGIGQEGVTIAKHRGLHVPARRPIVIVPELPAALRRAA